MHRFIYPRSVAVIGASENKRKVGCSLQSNISVSFKDKCFPVNPRYEEIGGLPCYPSVSALPESVDLAVIFVPARLVPDIIRECGTKDIRRVMIQSAGFAETGDTGLQLQEACRAIAKEHNIRLWGPNCMGVVNGRTRQVISFMRPDLWQKSLRPGGVSLIVQSGMLAAGFLVQILSENYFGLNMCCSIGNRLDVNECDLLEYMAQDPGTEIVAMYLESIADVPRFRKVVSQLNRPLILLKGATTNSGARAARSHTASMAGNARISEGLFRQLGIHRATDFIELMDLTKALMLWRGKTPGKNVAVVTFSGAAGIVTTDHLVQHGMSLAQLGPRTLDKLRRIYPEWMEPENPLDLWPAMELNGWGKVCSTVVEALVDDPQVDTIHFHVHVDKHLMKQDFSLFKSLSSSNKPAVFWIIGNTGFFREFRDQVEPLGFPVFTEINRGISALKMLVDYAL
jgi:acyl-CoA synthetase (NDP forming)